MQDAINNCSCDILMSLNLNWGSANNNGNLQSVVANNGGPGYPQFLALTETYSYDGVNRLSQWNDSNGGTTSFSYDQYGNLGGQNFADPTTNHSTVLQFDAAGHQTTASDYTLTYDAEGQMTQAVESPSNGGGQVSYVYDGLGQRVEKLLPQAISKYIYVYDAQGELAAQYYSFPASQSSCQTCYLSMDHLGSVRLVTDQNGQVAGRHDYLPFGGEIVSNSYGRDSHWGPSNDNVTQKFTGQTHDGETGFDNFNARFLTSSQGRFLSPDSPLMDQDPHDPQSWNLYSYVRNNPLRSVDPSGHYLTSPDHWYGGGGGGGCFECGLSLLVDGLPMVQGGLLNEGNDLLACPNNFCNGWVSKPNGGADYVQYGGPDSDNAKYTVLDTAPPPPKPADKVYAAFQLADMNGNTSTTTQSVSVRLVGFTYNVQIPADPFNGAAAQFGYKDPKFTNDANHPGSTGSYYVTNSIFGLLGTNVPHVADLGKEGIEAHYDTFGPANPLHWFGEWIPSLFINTRKTAQPGSPTYSQWTCTVGFGCSK